MVAAAVVFLDVTTRESSHDRQSSLAGYLAGVDHDVAQCRAGLHDAVVAYVGSATGTPAVAPGVPSTFTEQGISVCGFTDSGVVTLGSTAPPRQVASPVVDRIAQQVDAWAYLDAFTLLQDLKNVVAHPSDAAARAAFQRELGVIGARRHRIEGLVAKAERGLGVPVRTFPLTRVASLLPGGRLPAAKPSAGT